MPFDMIHAEFETWAGSYDADALGRTQYLGHEKVAQAVIRHVKPARHLRVVDLGIGTGLTAAQLRLHFKAAHITGCDFSAAMLKKCAEKNIADALIECDLRDTDWPLEPESADIVSCAGVLEFIHDADRFMANTRTVMKDGAVAALTYEVQAIAGKIGAMASGEASIKRTQDDMVDLAEQYDLRVIGRESFQGYAYYGRSITYGLLALRK